MPSYRQNKPEADILMNSMRSMGYTFESAIADILSKTLAIRLLEDGKRISTGVEKIRYIYNRVCTSVSGGKIHSEHT